MTRDDAIAALARVSPDHSEAANAAFVDRLVAIGVLRFGNSSPEKKEAIRAITKAFRTTYVDITLYEGTTQKYHGLMTDESVRTLLTKIELAGYDLKPKRK